MKSKVHCQQDRVRAEIHRQRFCDRFDLGIGFSDTPDVLQRFGIDRLADKEAPGFVDEKNGNRGKNKSDTN